MTHTHTPAPMCVTIRFADQDDARNFQHYVDEAKKNRGTVTGLYAGLMSSLIRDATIQPGDQENTECIAAVRALLAEASEKSIRARLEYLRGEIENERISYSEIAELQALAKYIDPSDVLLLQWAGATQGE